MNYFLYCTIAAFILIFVIIIRYRKRHPKPAPKRNLTKIELEKEKLKAEIKLLNRNQYWQPGFLTPLFTLVITVFVYGWLWNSGLFDAKQAHLTHVTDTLAAYKSRLDTNIIKLNDSSRKLNDSIQALIAKLNLLAKEEALAKQKYLYHEKQNLTKKELVEKTEALVKNINAFYDKTRKENDRLVSAMMNSSQGTEAKQNSVWKLYTDSLINLSNDEMNTYNILYKADAIHLRTEMEKYLPKNYQGKMNMALYSYAGGPMIEQVAADLAVNIARVKVTIQ